MSTAIDPSAMTGLDLLRAATSMENPPPNIGRLLGMDFDEIEFGKVVASLAPRADFSNPLGTVHGGIHATMLDSVMGCAVHSALPAGVGYTTLELKVNYVRAVQLTSERITATGTTIHVGGKTATAEGRIVDENGKLVAHGTTTCIIFR